MYFTLSLKLKKIKSDFAPLREDKNYSSTIEKVQKILFKKNQNETTLL